MKLLHSYRDEIILWCYTYQCLSFFFKVFIGRAYKNRKLSPVLHINILPVYLSFITSQYNQLLRKSEFTNSTTSEPLVDSNWFLSKPFQIILCEVYTISPGPFCLLELQEQYQLLPDSLYPGEKIVIHNPEKIGGRKHVTIEIYFTYVGKIRIPLHKAGIKNSIPAR